MAGKILAFERESPMLKRVIQVILVNEVLGFKNFWQLKEIYRKKKQPCIECTTIQRQAVARRPRG